MAAPHIFLSHSTKDIAFVRRLEADLQAAGATVYRVSADQAGSFQTRINEALAVCEYVVLALTADALASTWVVQEIEAGNWLKHQGRIKDILPIQAGPVDYRAIPPLWGVNNIFDASRDYAAGRNGLLRALGLPVAGASVSAAAPPPPRPAGAASPRPSLHRPRRPIPARLAFSLGFAGYTSGSVEYILPPVDFVAAGEFLMGSDPKRDSVAKESWAERRETATPRHSTRLPDRALPRHRRRVRLLRPQRARRAHIDYNQFMWRQQLDGRLDHPVVNVSWNDAVAYAAWLANATGQPWRLPSEAEWEKAARGSDGRIYPWGDSFDKARANTSEGGKGTTTPIGSYPNGASPYGAQEMAGNVWEWTSSLFKSYPYSQSDGQRCANFYWQSCAAWRLVVQLLRSRARPPATAPPGTNGNGVRLAARPNLMSVCDR